MQITDILGQIGGIQSVARELGVSEAQAASGVGALLPALLGGFKKQAQSQPTGLDGLVGMLGGLGGGGLLDDVLGPQPTPVNRGNDVLGQIFGSRDVSRTVAQNASARTGLDPSLLKKMLPLLAMLVAGYLAKQGRASAQPQMGGGPGNLGGGGLEQRGRRVGQRTGGHGGRRRPGRAAGSRLDARPGPRRQSAGRHTRHGRKAHARLSRRAAPVAAAAPAAEPRGPAAAGRGRRALSPCAGARRSGGPCRGFRRFSCCTTGVSHCGWYRGRPSRSPPPGTRARGRGARGR